MSQTKPFRRRRTGARRIRADVHPNVIPIIRKLKLGYRRRARRQGNQELRIAQGS